MPGPPTSGWTLFPASGEPSGDPRLSCPRPPPAPRESSPGQLSPKCQSEIRAIVPVPAHLPADPSVTQLSCVQAAPGPQCSLKRQQFP